MFMNSDFIRKKGKNAKMHAKMQGIKLLTSLTADLV